MVDLALFAGVTTVLSIVVSADQAGSRSPDLLAYLWAVGLGALMLVRRTMPRVVLALTPFGFFSYYAAGFPTSMWRCRSPRHCSPRPRPDIYGRRC